MSLRGMLEVEVVAVTLLEQPRHVITRRWAPWAWTAIALTPVVLAGAIGAGFVITAQADEGFNVLLAWILAVLAVALGIGTPAVAVLLAVLAARAAEPSGIAAVWVAGGLLFVALVGLPVLGYSYGTLLLAVLLYVVVGGVVLAATSGRTHAH